VALKYLVNPAFRGATVRRMVPYRPVQIIEPSPQ